MSWYITKVLKCILLLLCAQSTVVARIAVLHSSETSLSTNDDVKIIDEIIKAARNIPDSRFENDIKLIQSLESDCVRYYLETNKEAVFTRNELDTVGRSLIVFKSPEEEAFEADVYIVLKHVAGESNLYYVSKAYVRVKPFSIEWDEWEYSPQKSKIFTAKPRPSLDKGGQTKCSQGKCNSKYKTANHIGRPIRSTEESATSGYGWSDYPSHITVDVKDKKDPTFVSVKQGTSSNSEIKFQKDKDSFKHNRIPRDTSEQDQFFAKIKMVQKQSSTSGEKRTEKTADIITTTKPSLIMPKIVFPDELSKETKPGIEDSTSTLKPVTTTEASRVAIETKKPEELPADVTPVVKGGRFVTRSNSSGGGSDSSGGGSDSSGGGSDSSNTGSKSSNSGSNNSNTASININGGSKSSNASNVMMSLEACNKSVIANAKKDKDAVGVAEASAFSKGCASAMANAINGQKATANAISLKGNAIASSRTTGALGAESNAMTKGVGNSSAAALAEGKGHAKTASIAQDGHAYSKSIALNGSNALAYSRTNGSKGHSVADSKSVGGNSQSVAVSSDGGAKAVSSSVGGNAQSFSVSNGSAGAKSLSTSMGGNARSDAVSSGDGDSQAIALGGDGDGAGDDKFFDDMPEFGFSSKGKNKTKRNVNGDLTCHRFYWDLDNEFKPIPIKSIEPVQKQCTTCKQMPDSARNAILKNIRSKKIEKGDDNYDEDRKLVHKERLGIKPREFYASIFDCSLEDESPLSIPSYSGSEHFFISKNSFIGKRQCKEEMENVDVFNLNSNSALHILLTLNLKCDKETVETLDHLMNSGILIVNSTVRDHPTFEISKSSYLLHEKKLSKKEMQRLVSSILMSTYSNAMADDSTSFTKNALFQPKTSLNEPVSRSMSIVVSMLTEAAKVTIRDVKSHEFRLLREYVMNAKNILSAAVNDSYTMRRSKDSVPQTDLSMSSTHIKVSVALIEFIKYGTQDLGDDVDSVKTFWNFYKSYYNSISRISRCIFSLR